MLAEERYNAILRELEMRGAVTVQELCDRLKISESTARRDLITLGRQGRLIKVRGGATRAGGNFLSGEPDVPTKQRLHTAEKDRIARYAAAQIDDNDFVYIDAGTTTGRMIDYIENSRATFVTNGIVHARKLIQKGCRAYIVGGQIKLSTQAVVGTLASGMLRQYNFTKAFLGANGISLSRGFTTPDPEEALLKNEACRQAFASFVLADSSKFGLVSAVTFLGLDEACILTDRIPEEKYGKAARIQEIL